MQAGPDRSLIRSFERHLAAFQSLSFILRPGHALYLNLKVFETVCDPILPDPWMLRMDLRYQIPSLHLQGSSLIMPSSWLFKLCFCQRVAGKTDECSFECLASESTRFDVSGLSVIATAGDEVQPRSSDLNLNALLQSLHQNSKPIKLSWHLNSPNYLYWSSIAKVEAIIDMLTVPLHPSTHCSEIAMT